MGERSRKGWREERLQRQQQAHLAQFIFSFPSLTSPLSPLECRLADLHLARPTAPVCVSEEGGEGQQVLPLSPSTVCFPPSDSFTGTHLFLAWFSPGKGVDDDDEGSDSRNCSAFSVDSNTELFFSAVAQLRARLLLPVSTDFTWRW